MVFAYHRNEINRQILENPYVFYNVHPKDKAQIEEWILTSVSEAPIQIEKIHLLKPETIQTIWKNIKYSKQFGIKCNQEQELEKTLRKL